MPRRTDCRYLTQRTEEANKGRREGLWQRPAKTWEGLWEGESWTLRPSLAEGKRKKNRALFSFFSMRSTQAAGKTAQWAKVPASQRRKPNGTVRSLNTRTGREN